MIEPSSSRYGAPAMLVAKKEEGQYRLVCDFRSVNAKLIPDVYPLPTAWCIQGMKKNIYNTWERYSRRRATFQIMIRLRTCVMVMYRSYEPICCSSMRKATHRLRSAHRNNWWKRFSTLKILKRNMLSEEARITLTKMLKDNASIICVESGTS